MSEKERVKDPEGSALTFIVVLLVGAAGCAAWVASKRYHIYSSQLLELGIYLVLGLYTAYDTFQHYARRKERMKSIWPQPRPRISVDRMIEEPKLAAEQDAVLIGHETDGTPFIWTNEQRAQQTIASGMSGSGKTTLIESILQQDIARGGPVIFIDGKGERKLLDRILPAVAAAGRLHQFRLIDPAQPEISSAFNPFWAKGTNPDEQVAFVFESFKVDGGEDFFDQHQRVYLENIARILFYSGKRFNFYDVLVAAYDEEVLHRQMVVAHGMASSDPATTPQQLRTLEMSIQNVLHTFQDKERVSKIQGLINHMMTYMSDSLALITGPYDNLVTIEDVFDQNLILYVSLNVNVNRSAVTSLGRILLQNIQLAIGKRYEQARHGVKHSFVSILMDEFAPFAYQNFSTILVTARSANVAFLFALQNYVQLEPAGFGLKDSLSTGPNNTFMLRMRDDRTTGQFRKESGEVKQDRFSVRVEKGTFSPAFQEQGSGSKSEIYATEIRDEQLKRLPSGQMQVLMSDQIKGLKHLHVHIRQPFESFYMDDSDYLYPGMDSLMTDTMGLNLRFPLLNLEANRNDRPGKRGRGAAGRNR